MSSDRPTEEQVRELLELCRIKTDRGGMLAIVNTGPLIALCEDWLEQERTISNLAMLVRRLLRRVPDDVKVKSQAADYLKRKGLQGSILRSEEPHA